MAGSFCVPLCEKNNTDTISIENKNVLKSGLRRSWKQPSKRFSSHVIRCVKTFGCSNRDWQTKSKESEKKKKILLLERALKSERSAARRAALEKKRIKEERRKEAELKGSTIQIVKDTTKIKKWNKNARKQLLKMSETALQALCAKKV